jgi:hypothetical protein
MKLGQTSLFYGNSRIYRKVKPPEVDHHGPRAAWGPPLGDRTLEGWSPSLGLPLGQFGKREGRIPI